LRSSSITTSQVIEMIRVSGGLNAYVVAGGGDGVLRFWDATSGRQTWTLQAHKSHVLGIHFEGEDIITRGFGGDVTRWTLPTATQIIETCSRTTACDRIWR